MIAILTSGPGLGAHVPGLLLSRRLAERGVRSRVDVFEASWPEERRERIAASKQAYQRDFRYARLGQRLFRNLSEAFDPAAVDGLLREWRAHGVTRLVVLGGFWLPVADRYAAGSEGRVEVDVCHMDSVRSPSFARQRESPAHREIWLFDAANAAIPWTIPPSDSLPLPWSARRDRFVAHGGGWCMGTYREYAGELAALGTSLDVVVPALEDSTGGAPGTRFFMMDPAWSPWRDGGFPPFGEIVGGEPPEYARHERHHGSLTLVREARAVISKPGGGTLLDAFHCATPVVFLESFGEHEEHNASLWTHLGFGITFEDWRATGFAQEPLAEMHRRMLRRHAEPRDYPLDLATRARLRA
ncbi:glycosyltransferase family protein [Sphaerisporangium aureirubrum]|uniref:UDP-glucuronosyltransferase n=1 Tax=Sphaerisporangium aureirubrum TaxID=1544736 RepID=A0ABW1NDI2_9ACTN